MAFIKQKLGVEKKCEAGHITRVPHNEKAFEKLASLYYGRPEIAKENVEIVRTDFNDPL